jgi:hypothetical protein
MALSRINSQSIADGTVIASDIADGSITTAKLSSSLTISANTGSVSAPAISPTGDTNTGIFFPDADTIAFAEGGVEAMRIDANGRVGIGTTTPETKLNVYDASSAIISVDSDALPSVRLSRYSSDGSGGLNVLRKARGTLASPTAVNSADNSGAIRFQAYGGSNFRSIAQIFSVVSNYTSDTNISGDLRFATNGGSTDTTTQMQLTSAGNLQFNSGYGSVATAYGCRAWVNFEGNATPVAIRDDGNVSSITDNGTGLYTVNFTTAMPDANYSAVASGRIHSVTVAASANITTTSIQLNCSDEDAVTVDPSHVFVAVFR